MDAFHFRFLIGPFCYLVIIEALGHSQQLIRSVYCLWLSAIWILLTTNYYYYYYYYQHGKDWSTARTCVQSVCVSRAQMPIRSAKGIANNKYSTHVLCLRTVGLVLLLDWSGIWWDGITIAGPTSASPQWSCAWDTGAAFRLVYAKMAYCITSLCGLRSCSCHNFAQFRPRSQHQSQQCIPVLLPLPLRRHHPQSSCPGAVTVSSPAASSISRFPGYRLQAIGLKLRFVNRIGIVLGIGIRMWRSLFVSCLGLRN